MPTAHAADRLVRSAIFVSRTPMCDRAPLSFHQQSRQLCYTIILVAPLPLRAFSQHNYIRSGLTDSSPLVRCRNSYRAPPSYKSDLERPPFDETKTETLRPGCRTTAAAVAVGGGV
eukprot:6753911-Prymnesium_polylepis.1